MKFFHQTGVIPFKPEPARDDEDSKAEALKNPVRIVYLVCVNQNLHCWHLVEGGRGVEI